jgi:hypothetical protein
MWSCSLFARSFLHLSYDALGVHTVRIDEQGDHSGLGDEVGKQLDPLCVQRLDKEGDAREVAARPGETDNQAICDRICANEKNDWDRRSCIFRRPSGGDAAECCDEFNLAVDKIGSQCGQPISAALRPPVFDRHVLSLGVAHFTQPLAERGHKRAPEPGEPLPR